MTAAPAVEAAVTVVVVVAAAAAAPQTARKRSHGLHICLQLWCRK
uniref:Uncharacterized protein n=1 Tax=Setaria viridis TaxID=4556 RepID=A0A4U6VX02_SETVI|nr:hypothetical protein SEVIR_2G254850v2 [Setaria viridis]